MYSHNAYIVIFIGHYGNLIVIIIIIFPRNKLPNLDGWIFYVHPVAIDVDLTKALLWCLLFLPLKKHVWTKKPIRLYTASLYI